MSTSSCSPLSPPTVTGCGLEVFRYGWCCNQPTRSWGASSTLVVPGLKTSSTFANCRVPISPCCASWIKSDNCSSVFDQPLPTSKESGGLNLTEWYSPGLRAFSVGCSGRGRALASSCAEPPLPQAPSASANPTTTSTATTMGAADKSLLRLISQPPFALRGHSARCKGGLSRCPGLSISCTIVPEEGAAHRTDV